MSKKESSSGMTWRSGDWRRSPRPSPPYNGLQIDLETTRNQEGELTALNVTASDFTETPKGAQVEHSLVPEDGAEVSFSPSGEFTVVGRITLRILPSNSKELIVYSDRVEYGLEHHRHTVVGGLLELPIVAPAEMASTISAEEREPDAEQAGRKGRGKGVSSESERP